MQPTNWQTHQLLSLQVYNQGIWLTIFGMAEAEHARLLDFFMGVLAGADFNGAEVYWKTTTSTSTGKQVMYQQEVETARAKGLHLLDVSAISLAAHRQGLAVNWCASIP